MHYKELVNTYFMRYKEQQDIKDKKNITKNITNEDEDTKNKFFYLHHAYINKTLFVYVPKNCQANHPLEISSELMDDVFEHLLVFIDENAKLTIIEEVTSSKFSNLDYYRSGVAEIIVQPNAELTYFSIQ